MACSGYPPRIPVRAVATSSSNRLHGMSAARPVPIAYGDLKEQALFSTVDRAPIGTGALRLKGRVPPTLATLR
jgi:hypothetical protein